MIHTALSCLIAAAGLFDPLEIPLQSPHAHVFLAPRAGDLGAVHVVVAEGQDIRVYDTQTRGEPMRIRLPDGVSAWEYTDLDQDGNAEVIAIRGKEILSISPAPDDAPSEPRRLFIRDSLLGGTEALPRVLTRDRDGARVLALPVPEGFDLLSPAGVLLEHIPRPQQGQSGAFYASSVETPVAAAPGALEFQVSYFEPGAYLPRSSESQPIAAELRQFSTRQARDAVQVPPGTWPWFPLRNPSEILHRAHYAFPGTAAGGTLIAVTKNSPAVSAQTIPPKLGPQRRYPGLPLLPAGAPPDFNGDGWTDLMLYDIQSPAPSVATASRALLSGSWDLRITTHNFAPAKRRFDPRSQSLIKLPLPIGWLLDPQTSTGPLRHVLFRDFDGDGQSDFACAQSESRYGVWLSRDGAFRNEPDLGIDFATRPQEIGFAESLSPGAPPSIGFRLEDRFLLLVNTQRVPAVSQGR